MRRVALLVLTAAAFVCEARAQPFARFASRDGLSTDAVTALTQDRSGALWIGTEDGLNRFDGHSFRTYRHNTRDSTSLPGVRVTALLASVSGELWVGTSVGLSRLDRRTGVFHRVALVRGRTVSVADLTEDPRGRLWVATLRGGLIRYDPATGRTERAWLTGNARDDRASSVTDLHWARGELWARVERPSVRLCRVDVDRGTCRSSARLPPDLSLVSEQGGTDLLGVRSEGAAPQLYRVTPGDGLALIGSAPTLPFGRAVRVSETTLWMPSERGLVVLEDDGRIRSIEPDTERRGALTGFDVRALYRDRQGNVWVGTESGLFVWRPPARPFETYRRAPDDPATLSDDRVNGMAEAADGALWVTTNGGLNRLDPVTGRVRRVPVTADTPDPTLREAFWQIIEVSPGQFVVGSKRSGLYRLEIGPRGEVRRWTRDRQIDQAYARAAGETGVSITGVRSLFVDRRGRLWVGTSRGLFRQEAGGYRVYGLKPGAPPGDLGDDRANVVYEDRRGRIWVGTDVGLYRFDEAADAFVRAASKPPASLCGEVIWSMVESDADPGGLWVATVGGGLGRVDLATETARCLTSDDGLPSDVVVGVLADSEGALWATTNNGLARVDLRSMRVAVFTSADGLQGDAFNLMAQRSLSDGRLAVGGPSGLTVFDPAVAGRAGRRPVVGFSGVERFGELDRGIPRPGDTLSFAHDRNVFGFRFAALDYRSPELHRYRYRLAGLSDEWIETDGAAPRATFTAVPPGTYRFELLASAFDGDFSGEPAVLHIVVVPAWWQRPVVWGLFLLGCLSFVALAISRTTRHRVERERRQRADELETLKRLAEGRERERLRLARDLHDGPVQGLYRIGHDLDAVERGADGAPRVSEVRRRVHDVSGELREMLSQLRPTLARHLSLPDSLDSLVGRFAQQAPDVYVETDYATEAAAADETIRLTLYRVAQEALGNVAKHARARVVRLQLAEHEGGLLLVVEDDGVGFELPERLVTLARGAHFGLVGMAERVEAVGGVLEITPREGSGTTVRARVPHVAPEGG